MQCAEISKRIATSDPASRIAGKNLLLALFDIAYRTRLGLPLIVSAGLMLFGVHLRLEVGFEGHVEQADVAERAEEADEAGAEDQEGRGRMRHRAQE